MTPNLHVPGLGAIQLPRFLRSTTLDQKVVDYLHNAHSLEAAQRITLPSLADATRDPEVAALLRDHDATTRDQALRLEQRLDELGHGLSKRKLLQTVSTAATKPVLDLVRRDGEGKVLRDAFIAERMEIAAYSLLEQLALLAGDDETASLAREIRQEEVDVAELLEERWDEAVLRTIAERGEDDVEGARAALAHYVDSAYVMEQNVTFMLSSVVLSTEHPEILARVEQHLFATRKHAAALDTRIIELGCDRSVYQRAVAAAFAMVKGPLNELRSDKDGKNARDLYTVQAMQVAAYELLGRLATHAGDTRTAGIVAEVIADERDMSDWLEQHWGRFVAEDARRQRLEGRDNGLDDI